MNKKMVLYLNLLIVLFLIIVGVSYAYFSLIIDGNGKKISIKMGQLKLEYNDGNEIIIDNMLPGTSISKSFTITNTNDSYFVYNLIWEDLKNTVSNDELVIEIKCTRLNSYNKEEGKCFGLSKTPIKTTKSIKNNIKIEPNTTHKYDVTITFVETGLKQNYNFNAIFEGKLGVENSSFAVAPVYCNFSGDMVQGATYINGQYVYAYKQELRKNPNHTSNNDYFIWTNVDNDGWGVSLIDKDSTEPVTSKICTYINNKPVLSGDFMYYASKASSIDVSSLGVNNITSFEGMFYGTATTNIIGLEILDTSNVTDMSFMFFGNQVENIDVSNFDTSNVTSMGYMFYGSQATELDLSNFNTSKVTNMLAMFGYSKVTNLDLSSFDTSKVTDMQSMFLGTIIQSLDLRSFDTSNVTNMSSMFAESYIRNIDLSSFNTSKVTNMNEMFYKCPYLQYIYVSNFDVSNVSSSKNMFQDSVNIVNGYSISPYSNSCVDKKCANTDVLSGYFILKES